MGLKAVQGTPPLQPDHSRQEELVLHKNDGDAILYEPQMRPHHTDHGIAANIEKEEH